MQTEADELRDKADHLQEELAAAIENGEPEYRLESIAARAYGCIEDFTPLASPYSTRAKVVLESSTLWARSRAAGMVSLLTGLAYDWEIQQNRPAIDERSFDDSFRRHSDALRNWLVGFGAGVPALLVTHDRLIDRIAASGNAWLLASMFLGGVLIQVLKAFLFKVTAYAPLLEKWVRRWAGFADFVQESVLIDFGADLLTLGLFVAAALTTFAALTK